ncbi:two-component system, CitB family, response regulator [Desulfuromusa kysingii]|uniref:Transcriptional regulatory protein n=1 Tax=Desulfuromusa kysingii TaxID=37625 RepID=A0A1H4DXM1_9BACT|nr:response regulator [Desulfuromusa kysingii]SEA77327.1 two-component system, CitB family, response regulator [Desulfuromusa kysingii]
MKTIEVLIIEDNLKVAKAHQLYVEKVPGFSVTGVVNLLADATHMVDALKPDLVLLDVYFPDGNGMDFLDQLRTSHSNADVILITAAKEVKLLHNALRGGVFDYMIKPVFFERFEEALTKYRQHWEKLNKLKDMSQEEVDLFFQRATDSSAGHKMHDFPKGIDPLTLDKIIAIFDESSEKGLSAEEVGSIIGASRTTARKYLEYLISTNALKIELEYGTIGRPERRYFKV